MLIIKSCHNTTWLSAWWESRKRRNKQTEMMCNEWDHFVQRCKQISSVMLSRPWERTARVVERTLCWPHWPASLRCLNGGNKSPVVHFSCLPHTLHARFKTHSHTASIRLSLAPSFCATDILLFSSKLHLVLAHSRRDWAWMSSVFRSWWMCGLIVMGQEP